jgi:disulfide bond formation protein DsbB
MIDFVDTTLAILTLVSLLLSAGILFLLLTKKQVKFINKNIIYLTLVVSVTAMFGSLFYSEIAEYNPCKLCWYQRILIYPQVFILWLAMILKDKSVIKYVLLLSVLCLPISLYHYLMQFNVVAPLTCGTVGYSSSCSENFGANFGFITIPFMAFATVLLNTLLSLSYLLGEKQKD